MRFLVYGRTEYADPLEQITIVESDDVPTVETAGVGDHWLELVVIPEDEIIWVQRDGALVRTLAEVTA
jgi:hypothetical protein